VLFEFVGWQSSLITVRPRNTPSINNHLDNYAAKSKLEADFIVGSRVSESLLT